MDEFIMEGALKILENERPKLLFIGLVSPNIVGHAHTTESIELRESCEVADGLLGMLISRLKGMGWFEATLLILAADHGMADKPFSIDIFGELNRRGRRDLVENIAHLYNVPAVGGLYLHDLRRPLIDDTIEVLKEIEHVKVLGINMIPMLHGSSVEEPMKGHRTSWLSQNSGIRSSQRAEPNPSIPHTMAHPILRISVS